jgi:hypothetical protein
VDNSVGRQQGENMCPDYDQKQLDEYYQDDQVRSYLEKNLKPDINYWLYDKVPHTLTIGEFEKMSCKIHDLIMGLWE